MLGQKRSRGDLVHDLYGYSSFDRKGSSSCYQSSMGHLTAQVVGHSGLRCVSPSTLVCAKTQT